jgi:hypothetical protein
MTYPKKKMIGRSFGRLLVIEEAGKGKFSRILYRCLCSCGKEMIADGCRLRSGNKASCGCLQREAALSKIPQMIQRSTKYSSQQSLAIRVWKKRYCSDGLSFDHFLSLSQTNCHYCDSPPSNHLRGKSILFSYNGLDRLDSSLGHMKENCVSCCIICNRGKSNQSYSQAIGWMLHLSQNFNLEKEKSWKSFPVIPDETKYARTIYRKIKWKTTDLSFEQFYSLTKNQCYYCDGNYSNSYGKFDYNGLDRVNSDLPYLHSNLVPCCKYCNFAKGKLSLQQFDEWIARLKMKCQ